MTQRTPRVGRRAADTAALCSFYMLAAETPASLFGQGGLEITT